MTSEASLGLIPRSSAAGSFIVICEDVYDVTIMSKNTGHVWYIHNLEYPESGSCIIFHKHLVSLPYHRHGREGSLRQAVKSIQGHDAFQMNGRKPVNRR